MIVLGISGLHYSLPYKQQQTLILSPQYDRFVQGLDSAAALIDNGKIIAAAEEERFCGDKGTGQFPKHAIDYCLSTAGIGVADLDYIAHGFDYAPYERSFKCDPHLAAWYERVYAREVQLQLLTDFMAWPAARATDFMSVPHHLAHAASSFFLSGFEESLVLVADGMGEGDSLSLYHAKKNFFKPLATIPECYSLGIFYSMVTAHLGFQCNQDESKVMGLASYGDANTLMEVMLEFFEFKSRGRYAIPLMQTSKFAHQQPYPELHEALALKFGVARKFDEPITAHHQDIAAALQATLQNVLLHVLRFYQAESQLSNLCLAGGVALNCAANATIRKSNVFKNMYIQPAAGDAGTALGAALYVTQQTSASPVKFEKQPMPYWGPAFDNTSIYSFIKDAAYVEKASVTELCEYVAKVLSEKKIVGWFQGQMEFGPRALGNRSILADPRDPNMQSILNQKIKKRENFRPFAPVVLFDDAGKLFEIDELTLNENRCMQLTVNVRPEYRDALPAITHIDGSARVQVVSKTDNELLWHLLQAFKNITGIGVLINTSLNINRQPIVCNPKQALETFEMAQLDYLVMQHFVVRRVDHA